MKLELKVHRTLSQTYKDRKYHSYYLYVPKKMAEKLGLDKKKKIKVEIKE